MLTSVSFLLENNDNLLQTLISMFFTH